MECRSTEAEGEEVSLWERDVERSENVEDGDECQDNINDGQERMGEEQTRCVVNQSKNEQQDEDEEECSNHGSRKLENSASWNATHCVYAE